MWIGVDRPDLGDLVGVVAVVGQLVVALVDADHPVLLLAPLAAEHAGGDAGHVGLEGQDHQVAHQAEVLGEVGRAPPAGLTASVGRLDRRQGLGAGDPQFQLADAGEVLVELLAVGAAEPVVQAPGVVEHGVEDAGPEPVPLEAVGVVGPLGEEAVEDEPGVDLGRQGRGRRPPGDRVLVDARIAAVAVARAAVALDARVPARGAGSGRRAGRRRPGRPRRPSGSWPRRSSAPGSRSGRPTRRGRGRRRRRRWRRALSQVRPLRTSRSSRNGASGSRIGGQVEVGPLGLRASSRP